MLVISLAGELDGAAVDTAGSVLAPALADPAGLVVIDLAGITFVGAAGVALLYGLARQRPDRESLRLLPGRNPQVRRMLEVTGVGDVIALAAG